MGKGWTGASKPNAVAASSAPAGAARPPVSVSESRPPRTAILVIHGIGEQNPFQTLDPFARGLHGLYASRGQSPTLRHAVAERRDGDGDAWIESFVELDGTGASPIDVHEYYWAPLTEERMGARDLWRWFRKSVRGARRLRRLDPELYGKAYTVGRVWRRLFILGGLVVFVLYPLWRLLGLLSAIPGLSFLSKALDLGKRVLLRGYIEDLAIYTSMDAKSQYFEIRNKILAHGQALLLELLRDSRYDRVVVAGHSLGSVIAYDMLSRLMVQASVPGGAVPGAEKLERGGLATFGSPLDEVRFFFLDHAERGEWVRRQVMDHLHAFRAVQPKSPGGTAAVTSPLRDPWPGMAWVNYHSDQDPVSGSLELFRVNDNVRRDYGGMSWVRAHLAYWDDPAFYRSIDERFLTPPAPPHPAPAAPMVPVPPAPRRA
jgi:hypothetical protein